MSSANGFRRIAARGRKEYLFNPQPGVTYYASAQTIDNGFLGSVFGNEIMFVVQDQLIDYCGPITLDFGSVYLNNTPAPEYANLVNIGNEAIVLNSITLQSGYSVFEVINQDVPITVPPGSSYAIGITFTPMTEGIVSDSLIIASNATNHPQLTFALTGRGVSSPPDSVQNLQIAMIGADAHLSWDAVLSTTTGDPIEVNRYLVLFDQLPDNQHFGYLTNTTALNFIHLGVGQFSPSCFYRIVALILYDREDALWLDEISAKQIPVSLLEVQRHLGRK
ncbi:MAG: hypothetical protein Q8M98_09235 [Candidatus Cloacimonadaceae bacterium]|nr:hypothetical protein [Candidatus Cloacimonadaceae bacterium]